METRIPQSSFWHKAPFVCLALGAACLVAWALGYNQNPERAMYSYLFSFVSVLSIALGCMVFVIIQHLTRAGWSVVVRRVAEAGMAVMPLFALLFIPIAWTAGSLFPWAHIDPNDIALMRKASYLNLPFMLSRSAVYLVVWMVIGVWFYRTSVAQDEGKLPENTRKMWFMSAPSILLFALTVTFASFDWIMSLQPHWYSTIFGVYFFAGCLLSGLAFMTLICLGLQNAGVLKADITSEHYQDLGKLMFAFVVFSTYIGFSQFMLYWYANIPEEVEFYAHRLNHGWGFVSYALPITNFFVPFFILMSRHVKRNRLALTLACFYILVVHFLDLYWLMLPTYGAHAEEVPHMEITQGDLLSLIGMLFIYMGCVAFILVRNRVAPVGDPRMNESLAFENF